MNSNNYISYKTLFICYGYKGIDSKNANAICLYNILCKLENKEKYCVITSGTDKEDNILLDDILTINIDTSNFKISSTLSNVTKNKLNIFKRNAINRINDMVEKDMILNVVCISFPFVNMEIGMAIKSRNPSTRFLVYELDPYAHNGLLRSSKLLFLYRWYKEKTIFELADKIYLTSELNILYRKNIYKRFKDKFVDLGIPMLDVLPNEQVVKSNKECRIVYTGSLSKKFRDPTFILELFTIIKDCGEWTLHIYGADRSSVDEIYIDELKDKLFLYDKVPRSEVKFILKEASMLLNISNNTNSQLPSKLLDYIGYRKPIINSYAKKNDLCNKYLMKYPLKLSIKQDNSKKEYLAGILHEFILKYDGKICEEKQVLLNYKELSTYSIIKKMMEHL